MKKIVLGLTLLSTGLAYAEKEMVFSHSHNGKTHSHALSADSLDHDHSSEKAQAQNVKKGTSVSHEHNGRSHKHPLPATGTRHVHGSGAKTQQAQGNSENTWLKQGGWASFKEVCEYKKTYISNENMKKANCNTPTLVTQNSSFALWAGEITHIHYHPSTRKFSNPKIKVTWTADKGKYQCGQVIQKSNSELKEFTHRSIAMKKCSSSSSQSSSSDTYTPADVGAALLRYFYF